VIRHVVGAALVAAPIFARRLPRADTRAAPTTDGLFGNTAVVMGSTASETLSQPEFRFTLVFLNPGQGWQMIAAHLVGLQPAK
jgi:hypothetical protein